MPYQDWSLKTDRICPNQIMLHCQPHRLFYWWSQRVSFCNCPRHLMFLKLLPFLWFYAIFYSVKDSNFRFLVSVNFNFYFLEQWMKWMKLYDKSICSVLYTYSVCINLTVVLKIQTVNNITFKTYYVCFINMGYVGSHHNDKLMTFLIFTHTWYFKDEVKWK